MPTSPRTVRRIAAAAATAIVVLGGAAVTAPVHAAPSSSFDLQSHRGGRGEHTEESLYGFARSVELGVTTLELDIVLTKDTVPLIWHDPTVQADKCTDTAPVTPGDPQFPYVGKVIHDLSYAQVQTLRCDKKLPKFPDAKVVQGNRIATLPQLFDLVAGYRGNTIRYNIETKIEAEDRAKSAQPQEFVDRILGAARTAGVLDRISVQSFDWRSLPLVRAQAPTVPLVALYDATTWKRNSAWLGAVSFEKSGGDVVRAAKSAGFDVLSPDYALSDAKLVAAAHAAGMQVIPWTVNEEAEMRRQIGFGVDGIITDYPTRLRSVLAAEGTTLPPAYRA
ncbi:Glycerophosphoryl diester phosphodiesterase OS=Tsukamurella paurometabola (strain ATCC 8368 / DSM / CCUG 35730 / CIP 100753 / JCM 10117 / KCTC 9821 / NBRC 16120 / NCIMB 702349 / NCTC 13040) OX=521096 GN=Tpau_1740 PE=4 SV=1 [Tsukamurella paurometabola]|uniref:Glycerophosphoryl diester phosphodiesterase n=1 Tax=Tsukamurella paurometabola (strain ATCC 8368 / DSM 20162 / CCUG 35730 / CIP 100753 / JCM 10117 / KCTC 9821 / NBRC 16120 / NCIMB 702349 / NCTC 13040) TaxID=521096 RepID=D5UM78_TSUPD|nr:glycerophosphodiester phosphodiesterase [Tsukamurella paurometabola]ADG78358.1 glycerophosphoryl diester phosphodiesterase [Tsukamurella paurometabola DSM 20162]SUP31336.1 cytoplasmic glycerophosphodiester phosphodiesterase [Tsukamurella paurometabola]